MEFSLALAQLAFNATVGRRVPLLSGNGGQLRCSGRGVDMDLFDCRFQDCKLVAALCSWPQGVEKGVRNRPPRLGEDCLHRPPDAAAIAPTMLWLEFPICGEKVYNAHSDNFCI